MLIPFKWFHEKTISFMNYFKKLFYNLLKKFYDLNTIDFTAVLFTIAKLTAFNCIKIIKIIKL